MATDFKLNAKARTDVGKGASRRLRRLAGQLPAIVYGGDKAPFMINVPHKDLTKALEDERFYSHIISLDIEGVGAATSPRKTAIAARGFSACRRDAFDHHACSAAFHQR